MKTSSAKQKGRLLQKSVVESLLNKFYPHLTEDDVRSCSMGAGGEDVQLSAKARKMIKCSFECKNQERFGALTKAFEQCKANAKGAVPIVIIKTNRLKPVAVVDMELFIRILHMLNIYSQDWDKLLRED